MRIKNLLQMIRIFRYAHGMRFRTHLRALNFFFPPESQRPLGPLLLGVALASLAALGCSDSDDAGKSIEGEGSQPAIVVGNRVCTADECLMYLGAVPEVPTEELDNSKMLELSGVVWLTLFEGRVYSYDPESAKLTKYIIKSDFLLEPAGVLSFADFGATGSAAYTQMASATRAFSYVGGSSQTIVVWNPTTMEVEREVPMPELIRDGMEADANPPVVVAGQVQWPLKWSNFGEMRYVHQAAVLTIDTESLEVEVLEDDRSAFTSVLRATKGGDTLAFSDNLCGWFNLFGEAAGKTPPESVLRVKAGKEFDPDYQVDLRAATGSPAVYGGWFLGDNSLLVRAWDPDVDPSSVLTEAGDFWGAEEFVSMMLVDLTSGTAEKFDVPPRGGAGSTGDPTEVDGKVYIPVYHDEGNQTEMFAVTAEGAELAFPTNGDVLFMGRAR
jgi:hypothetical protein